MNFIVILPKTQKKPYDNIFIIIHKLIEHAHFFATKSTMLAMEVAKLFIKKIFRLHGFMIKEKNM
jgi:hypothetical protein